MPHSEIVASGALDGAETVKTVRSFGRRFRL